MTGAEFKRRRTDMQMSIKALAELMGVSDRQVMRWEASQTVRQVAADAMRWHYSEHTARGR